MTWEQSLIVGIVVTVVGGLLVHLVTHMNWQKSLIAVAVVGALAGVLLYFFASTAKPKPPIAVPTPSPTHSPSAQPAVPTPTRSPSPTAPTPTQNGTLLVPPSSLTMYKGDAIPLGTEPPTGAQVNGPDADLVYNTFAGEAYFASVVPNSQMVGLQGLSPPTYQACIQSLDPETQNSAGQGSSFCLIEKSKMLMIGVQVVNIDTSAINPGSVMIQTRVWRYSV